MARSELRWGILATGGIARQFAEGLAESRTGRLVAVGSRNEGRAAEFAATHSAASKGETAKAYGSAESLLADPDVDAVYIASPHHVHNEQTILAARAGKGILCEKPFCLNRLEAEEALAAVDAAGVFFMEAFMYRVSPQMEKLRALLAEKMIGDVQQINAEFGFAAGRDWDNFRTEAALGGGGLMDVGTYCVSLARMVFGADPVGATYVKGMDEGGYDGSGAGLVAFGGGRSLHFGTGVHLSLKNDARIYGTGGWIHISDPWKSAPEAVMTVYRNGALPEEHRLGLTNAQLYAAEAEAVAGSFDLGECPAMTKADTLGQARALDALKASAGMRFAADPA